MSERRSLVEGVKAPPSPTNVSAEKQFVYGRNDAPQPQAPIAPALGSTPISTRLRSDLVAALKKASLERQLEGVQPNTLRDILEQAIEPWLRTHGYLGD